MAPGAVEGRGADVLLRVRVQPKAASNRVIEACDDYYRVSLTAPPVDGAANDALVAYLAKVLAIPRRRIALNGGKRSRTKSLLIADSDPETLQRILNEAIAH